MSQPKSGYAYLASQYFRLCGAIRKHFTGSGRTTDNDVAELIITAATVRVTDSKRIYFKDSVAQLRAVYNALQPQTVEA